MAAKCSIYNESNRSQDTFLKNRNGFRDLYFGMGKMDYKIVMLGTDKRNFITLLWDLIWVQE